MKTEKHEISVDDAWKYNEKQQEGDKCFATIFYDDEGNFDKEKTFSDQFLKQRARDEVASKVRKGIKDNVEVDTKFHADGCLVALCEGSSFAIGRLFKYIFCCGWL